MSDNKQISGLERFYREVTGACFVIGELRVRIYPSFRLIFQVSDHLETYV